MPGGRPLFVALLACTVAFQFSSQGASQGLPVDVALLQTFAWQPLGLAGVDVSRVTTDATFPYRVCAFDAAGANRCRVRHDDTADGAWESLPLPIGRRVTPDPNDADVLFTSELQRYDRRTSQSTWVGPLLAEQFRGARSDAALAFSADGRTLFAGLTSVWRTTTNGQTWTAAGPDFSTTTGTESPARISTLAASPIDARIVWAGTTAGTVHLTRDAGTTWTSLAPSTLPAGASITHIEPSRFDPLSAYLTATRTGIGAALWRTRDNGVTWTTLGQAVPREAHIHVVREDAFRRGLLFAATDASVFVSMDDGDSWQPFGTNLPTVAVTDLTVRDAELIVGTRGHGVWTLSDFSPLRQITPDVARAPAFLFRPAQTWRPRASANATASSGAAPIAYHLGAASATEITLGAASPTEVTIDIIETATGELIRRFSSAADGVGATERLPAGRQGLQRVVWDLRYARPELAADAPPAARVLPGTYQVRLTAGTVTIRQSVAIRLDPRVRASAQDLAAARTLARAVDRQRADVSQALLAADVEPARRTALAESLQELRRFAVAIDAADQRPSPAFTAAAEAALARAEVAAESSR